MDECEDNPERTFAVNVVGVRDLAVAAQAIGAVLVHFSTDYAFDGRKRHPYQESDCPDPPERLRDLEASGQVFHWAILEPHFVIRTCGLYGLTGSRGKGGNFVETMLRLARGEREIRVVGDRILTPTNTKELARKVRQLVEIGAYGLYHITNHGECLWCQFAAAIFEMAGLHPSLRETTSAEYGARTTRPAFSVLDNANL